MYKDNLKVIFFAMAIILVYFLISIPDLMDDGNQYQGFTESLAKGKLDFKSYYGFQGMSILAVPVYWLTRSNISIIILSAALYILSLPLAYSIGKNFYSSSRAGVLFMSLVLLMPYTYTTMMRGFQEAALLFFILLTIYGAISKNKWTPLAWSCGGLVKPFNLVLFPLFIKDFLNKKKITWILIALLAGIVYLGLSYYQTGHLVNNAAIGSYGGNFDTGNPPPLIKSFVPGIKGFLRVGANLLLHYRKILISPLVIIIGVLVLLKNKNFKLRNEIILAILLNIILVGSLTFSFSKYLLPMVVLLALCSIQYLLKYKWLFALVLIDSFFVFPPIWNYFGYNFWPSQYLYLVPFYCAAGIYIYMYKNRLI